MNLDSPAKTPMCQLMGTPSLITPTPTTPVHTAFTFDGPIVANPNGFVDETSHDSGVGSLCDPVDLDRFRNNDFKVVISLQICSYV